MAPSLSTAVLSKHTPSTWSYMPLYKEHELIKLSEHSSEYSEVVQNINATLSKNIDVVARVQNPYLWGCYLLKKEEYLTLQFPFVEEMKLLHATSEENIPSIVRNNLDWKKSKRTKYGHGVSFTPNAVYANTYCSEKIGDKRAIIVARVLVKLSTKGHYGTKLPPPPFDTTTGKNGKVVVKYCDNEFYPEYVAYYKN